MKSIRAAVVLFVVLVAAQAFGQAPEPTATDAARLKDSLAKWEKARQDCGGDYAIVARWSSAFGFGNTTTITVKANKVTERKFEEFGRAEPGKAPEPKVRWIEMGKDLGSNKQGAPALTVDELYAEAKKVAEAEVPANHVRSLGFDKQGLLSYCFLRDTRIADDAPLKGVSPFQIQPGPKK